MPAVKDPPPEGNPFDGWTTGAFREVPPYQTIEEADKSKSDVRGAIQHVVSEEWRTRRDKMMHNISVWEANLDFDIARFCEPDHEDS